MHHTKKISIDLQFKNPACPEKEKYPAFIACPIEHLENVVPDKSWKNKYSLKIKRRFWFNENSKDDFYISRSDGTLTVKNPYLWHGIDLSKNYELPLPLKEGIDLPLSKFYSLH